MGVLRIADDQISSPTWARVLAEATSQIIAQGRGDPVNYLHEKSGLYHLAGGGSCSRYEWAKTILEFDPKKEEQVVKEILTARSSEFPTSAVRPSNTTLDCKAFEKTFSLILPSWQQTLLCTLQ